MGSKEGECQGIGYEYYLGFAYAYATTTTALVRLTRAETEIWYADTREKEAIGGSVISAQTSEISENNPADGKYWVWDIPPETVCPPDESCYQDFTNAEGHWYNRYACDISVYTGNQTVANPYLSSYCSYPLVYPNTSYLVFPSAYVGDNVKTIPVFKPTFKNISIDTGNWGKPEVLQTDEIEGRLAVENANPVYVIYSIMIDEIKLNPDLIDIDSFKSAALVVDTEKLGIGFVMTKEKAATVWIKEILRHIDGFIFYDSVTGKHAIKLARDDYDIATIAEITDSTAEGIKFTRGSWEDSNTSITYKYTNLYSGETCSITLDNPATRAMVGYEKTQSVEFMMFNTLEALELTATRNFKKLSYPLATVNFSVSSVDYPSLKLGDVVKISSVSLGITDFVVRVVGIGADKEDTDTLEIETIEDIFSIGSAINIHKNQGEQVKIDYTLGSISTFDKCYKYSGLTTISSAFYLFPQPSGTVLSNLVELENDNTHVSRNSSLPSTLEDGVVLTTTATNGIFTPYFDGVSDLVITMNKQIIFDDITASDLEYQQGKYIFIINGEFYTYRNRVKIDDSTYRITGISYGLFRYLSFSDSVYNTAVTTGNSIYLITYQDLAGFKPFTGLSGGNYTATMWSENSFQRTDAVHNTLQEHEYTHSERPATPMNIVVTRDSGNIIFDFTKCEIGIGFYYGEPDSLKAGDFESTETDTIVKVLVETTSGTFVKEEEAVDGYSLVENISFAEEAVGTVYYYIYSYNRVTFKISDKIKYQYNSGTFSYDKVI